MNDSESSKKPRLKDHGFLLCERFDLSIAAHNRLLPSLLRAADYPTVTAAIASESDMTSAPCAAG